MGVARVISPASARIRPGVTITPSCAVVNYGSNPQFNVPVLFEVESAGVLVYDEAVLVPSLPAYDTVTAILPEE
ncbi:hypothetical protein FJY69_04125, partial [candidate division WOR-3 bacterium]|nr:hypothetical protein [candidate division WOR-3 bacterium]